MARDYYAALGVPRNASTEEIQQAFRRLARANHPDVNKDPGAEDRFKEINEAYQVLSDPDQRRRYDRFGPDFRQYAEAGAGAGPGRDTRARGGRPPPGGGRWSGTRVHVSGAPGDFGGIDLDDLFGSMFGARGAAGPIPGADQEAELELSLEEAYRGGRHEVALSGPAGRHTYTVDVPPGATDGTRIRLAGEGGSGGGGGPSGDLYLVVRIAPHPRYRVEGRDLHVDLPVAPWDAALGATVVLETPGGDVKVKVPPGTSSGRWLRLRGQGLPASGSSRAGDLYAHVKIVVPTTLTPRERELFEALARESRFDPRR